MNFKNQIRIIALLLLLTAIAISGTANRGLSHPMNGFIATSDSVNIELLHAKKPGIRLYSRATREGITFMNAQLDNPLEFFIFDVEGVLIHQTILHPKEKKIITDLKKGIYLYDLFYKDEGIERGKITIQ